MKLLEANERILRVRFPEVLRRIRDAGQGEAEFAFEGSGTRRHLVLKMGEKELHPYGRANPRSLSQRWASQVEYKKSAFYAVSGFGFGWHLEALLEKLDKDNFIFAGERNPLILGAALASRDCSTLLSDHRLILGTGEMGDKFFEPLREVQFTDIRHTIPLIFSPLFSLDENYYEGFFTEFARNFDFWRRLYRSNIRDSSLWQRTTLENLPLLLTSPDIGETRNWFSHLPVVLIGAGPSLDESIEFLRTVQNRAILVSVNSSYRKLVNNGIVPHLTIAADPRDDTGKGYAGLSVNEVTLVCPFFVCPQVVQKFAGRVFTWTGHNALSKLVRQRLGYGEGSMILEQGTVSACIVDLAKLWDCTKICLVGQDMALTPKGQTHTLDSFYADENRVFGELSSCRFLPGNTIDKVPVDEPLFVYLKTFCQVVENYPSIDFINTARYGARIAKAPYLEFEEAASWLGYGDSGGVRERLSTKFKLPLKPSQADREMKKALKPTLQFARKVFQWSLQAALHLELLPMEVKEASGRKHEAILEADRQASRINEWLDSHPSDYQILFDGKTKAELFRCREKSKTLSATHEHWERVLKNREYYWALVEGANFLTHRLEPFLSRPSCS